MPRKGRGGKVEGAAGTAYANRSDLNQRGPEPITAAPGQTYGEAAAQKEAQRAVPMAGIQTPAPSPNAPQMAPQAPMGQAPAPTQASPIQPGTGPLDLFAPAPHPDPSPNDLIAAKAPAGTPQNAMLMITHALSDAASSPFATSQVQELAALAKTML